MEQQSPLHPKDEAAQKPKRAIFPSLKFIGRVEGGGGGRGGGGGGKGGGGAEKIFNLVCPRL